MEFIKFMFSSFWVYIGISILITVILVVLFDGIANIIRAIKMPKINDEQLKNIFKKLLNNINDDQNNNKGSV